MKTVITTAQLNELTIVEGALFEAKYLDRASDDIYDAMTIEEVVQSAQLAMCGYLIPDSRKYGRELINIIVEHRGFRYGLGVTFESGNRLSVNTFLKEGMIDSSWKDGRTFPKFFIQ